MPLSLKKIRYKKYVKIKNSYSQNFKIENYLPKFIKRRFQLFLRFLRRFFFSLLEEKNISTDDFFCLISLYARNSMSFIYFYFILFYILYSAFLTTCTTDSSSFFLLSSSPFPSFFSYTSWLTLEKK